MVFRISHDANIVHKDVIKCEIKNLVIPIKSIKFVTKIVNLWMQLSMLLICFLRE